jgi:hypothetical protein
MVTQSSIDTSAALFEKLERAFLRRATYGDYQIDWVFDVAVTAWHLVDWAAREAAGSDKAAVHMKQDSLKQKCPALAVCEQICNGAKHLVLDDPRLRPFSIASDVRGTTDLIGVSADVVPGGAPIDLVLTPRVLVTDRDGKTWDAILLLRSVLSFWRNELSITGVAT